MIFPSYHQPSEVSPPCEGSFDLPSSLVATATGVHLGLAVSFGFAMRTDQLNASSCQSRSQRIGVGGLVIDQPARIFPRPTAAGARHRDSLQCPARSTRLRPGTPSPSSFPEEDPGRLPPPSTSYPFRVWFCPRNAPFFAGQNCRQRRFHSSPVGPVHQLGLARPAMPLAKPRRFPKPVADASTYSARDSAPAGLATAPHYVTPTKCLQTPGGWRWVWTAFGGGFRFGQKRRNMRHCSSVNSHVWRAIGDSLGRGNTRIRKKSNPSQVMKPLLGKGIPFLSARNTRLTAWSLEDVKFISQTDYDTFCQRVKPEMGDVLYTKGGTTGVARAVDLDFPFQVWVHVAVLKVRKDRVLPHYLATVLNTPRCYEQSQLFTRGATNQDLGLGRMKNIVLPLPPLAEQSKIIERVMAVQSAD